MLLFGIFLLGLIIGSFLNVCIYRIPNGDSIIYPRSYCTSCESKIKWYDMIPVISYIILKGKCRNCGSRISIHYPIIELATGIIFVALFLKYGLTLEFAKFAVLSSFVIVIGMIDYYTTDVYTITTLSGIVAGIFFIIAGYLKGGDLLTFIYAALISYGLIAAIALMTKGMGWGDAEICLMCSLFLGLKLSIVMLFMAFVSGGILGMLLVLFRKSSLKSAIAFGPFISGAAIFASVFGSNLIDWYMAKLF
jgi:leader peptidase (prepilin peptidase)/N-methyltransferase